MRWPRQILYGLAPSCLAQWVGLVMPPAGSNRPDRDLLERLIEGQASGAQQISEIFRRLDTAEKTAAEARDVSREIVTILREQDALARVAEVKAETRQLVADLRSDVVKANTNMKADHVAISERVDAIEQANSQAAGALSVWQWLARHAGWFLAAAAAFLAGLATKFK